MNRILIIGLFISLTNSYQTYAQWTAKDSIWLQNILSGKDSIQLNPETMRAIEGGTFLNFDQPAGSGMSAPSEIPIIKDFSDYFQPEDTVSHKVALKDLPPYVFWHYGKNLPLSPLQVNPALLHDTRLREHARYPSGSSFDHLLQMAFSPTYRNIQHNRKHAVAWKTYNNLPSKELNEKQKKQRKDQANLPLPLVTTKSKKDSIETTINIVPDEYILSIKDSTSLPGDSVLL
ncbi:DUF4858 domain-containing protein [Parabacteroides sp. PF5-9]|uniref:DUF4858 domain-containing protein n=1 Tax=Parabacteroides sp. PF5-9 TaxID=1742404 RepID=UPI0024751AE4|nr:DUF4858 domain-containing protein [Parabacteroides sp. PF5-9]MDH6358727.1 hypothetical protein [Parabacteroides sp. PF5-9]